MDPRNEPIFENGMDETAAAYLLETTRWTKFLGIISIIFSALMLLVAVTQMYAASQYSDVSSPEAAGVMVGKLLYFVLVACFYIYPAIALLKFSSCMKRGIPDRNQALINDGFRYQKNFFRYIGILTIIALALILLAAFFGLLSA